jgi:hypothetical protein
MHTGIALLHATVPASAHEASIAREERRADGDSALVKAQPRFFERHDQHLFVDFEIRGRLHA